MRFVAQGEQFVLASNYKPLWEMRGATVIRKPGVFLCLALFWLVSSATVNLESLCQQKDSPLVLDGLSSEIEKDAWSVHSPKPAAPRTCDPPPIPQRPLYRDTGRQAGRQAAFSGALSCALLYSKGPEGLREPSPHAVYLLLPNMVS